MDQSLTPPPELSTRRSLGISTTTPSTTPIIPQSVSQVKEDCKDVSFNNNDVTNLETKFTLNSLRKEEFVHALLPKEETTLQVSIEGGDNKSLFYSSSVCPTSSTSCSISSANASKLSSTPSAQSDCQLNIASDSFNLNIKTNKQAFLPKGKNSELPSFSPEMNGASVAFVPVGAHDRQKNDQKIQISEDQQQHELPTSQITLKSASQMKQPNQRDQLGKSNKSGEIDKQQQYQEQLRQHQLQIERQEEQHQEQEAQYKQYLQEYYQSLQDIVFVM